MIYEIEKLFLIHPWMKLIVYKVDIKYSFQKEWLYNLPLREEVRSSSYWLKWLNPFFKKLESQDLRTSVKLGFCLYWINCSREGEQISKRKAHFEDDFSLRLIHSNNCFGCISHPGDWCWWRKCSYQIFKPVKEEMCPWKESTA